MFAVDDYPLNYNFLSKSQQDEILSLCDCYRKNDKEKYTLLVQAFSCAGIKIEYNWYGHRNEIFLATHDDALYQEDCLFENL